jgi:putative SbcD/Mre11-related phosphoesterase
MSQKAQVLPIYGERALTIGKTLVVAELHIGMEHMLREQGMVVPSQTKTIEKKLKSLIKRTGAEELIILGDVKHNIPTTSLQEYREVPLLLNALKKVVDITIVKGNHDGNLEKLLPGFMILDYIEKEDIILVHGHAWIKAKSIDASVVVLAHSHPAIAFVDEFSRVVKEPAWIKGRFNEKIREHYDVHRIPEFIVMPAFNPLISGTSFNHASKRKPLGPWFKSGVIELETAHAYLLDGTDIGPISELKAPEEEAQ